jgi:hypothetical protein
MYLSGYKDHQVPMVLVEWKYSIMEDGEQYVMMVGILMMLRLYVVNWDLYPLLELFKVAMFSTELARYGWMMFLVLDMNKI